MRHRKSGKKLGRTWEHRKAMFRNMARSLITYGRIKTTAPKAKELSKVVDKLVTLAKRNDLSSRRQAYKVLENHSLVQKLFDEIGPKFSQAKGGYTRVVKFATPRVGDSAAMAMIEFTYFETEANEVTESDAAKPAQSAAASPAQSAAASPASSAPPSDAEAKDSEAPVESKETDQPLPEEEVSQDASVQPSEDAEIKAEDSGDSKDPENKPDESDKEK